ncbi:MAG: DUF86 domain-containing protein [Pseudarcicella sp.]|nr:DUF86 domain-containing protein [Pseudarcicella sp.]
MESDQDLFRLYHIRVCIDKIVELVKILHTQDNFETRWIEQDAMIRNFEIIGEASNHISDETKRIYPNLEWKEMRAMRNYITHEYFGVDLASIWDTAINDIPRLKIQITQIITDLESK